MLTAGFAQADITPPLGTAKIGALRHRAGSRVADPLFACAAVLDDGARTLAIVALDVLSVSRRHVAEIRLALADDPGLCSEHVLVAATHTHGGGALVRSGVVPQDPVYRDHVTDAVLTAVRAAHARRQPAELASARAIEPEIAHNRRAIQRDGTVRTHGTLQDPGALCIEGPNDPEVSVHVIRTPGGAILGCIACYACHPTDHGGDDVFSAGFPGVLATELQASGVPITLYLNGALGNVHPMNPAREGQMRDMNYVGARLADRVRAAIATARPAGELQLSAGARSVRLPFRAFTEAERNGAIPGAQRYAARGRVPAEWPTIYAEMIADFEREAAEEGTQVAEVQCLALGHELLLALPAEPFVELGLAIKEAAFPRFVTVVGLANGMIGYVPTRAAFHRGGYETTLSTVSKLAPEAGDMLVQTSIKVLAQTTGQNESWPQT